MIEPLFTRGPWLAAAKPSSVVGWPIVAPSAGGRSVASVTYAAEPGPFNLALGFNVESKANSHLISAAPELYAACQQLLFDVFEDACPDTVKRARAALAKAEGREPSKEESHG